MATIEKKSWPEIFEAVRSGKKRFDLRLNDFTVQEGDLIVLKEYDPKKGGYTGRSITKKVGYVLRFKIDELPFWNEEDVTEKGLQIISLEEQ